MRLPDPKEIVLAKHAQHVVLIHFPIALCFTGVLFDFLAQWRKSETLATAAFYNFSVAAVFVPPTIVTGLLAWQFQLEGARLKGSLLLHLILAIASGVVILGTWLLHLRVRREQGPVSAGARLAIEGFGALLLAAAAHLGGVVSGVNPLL